jgi:repressor of nif and glnA expression
MAEVKDIETAEAIAKKLSELGLGYGRVRYDSTFRAIEKGIIRKKRKAERMNTELYVSVMPNANSIEEYKEIRKKLKTIAHNWKKQPSYDGTWLYLKSKIGNIEVSVGIAFPTDKIESIMSELLKCKIERRIETHKGYTTTSFACKTANATK